MSSTDGPNAASTGSMSSTYTWGQAVPAVQKPKILGALRVSRVLNPEILQHSSETLRVLLYLPVWNSEILQVSKVLAVLNAEILRVLKASAVQDPWIVQVQTVFQSIEPPNTSSTAVFQSIEPPKYGEYGSIRRRNLEILRVLAVSRRTQSPNTVHEVPEVFSL